MSVRIIQGDCREVLRTLPDASVHMVCTSPPYYGLRDYGVAGQIGLELSPSEYVAEVVSVFREARRVLRDDGTLWLNLGDSYMPENRGENAKPRALGPAHMQGTHFHADLPTRRDQIIAMNGAGIKRKDLVGIPWAVAFALRDDGWWLRSDIIWAKPNPMPESITDRPTTSHERVFLLTKRPRYFYDAEGIREMSLTGDVRPPFAPGQVDARGNGHDRREKRIRGVPPRHSQYESSDQSGLDEVGRGAGRNARNVWTIATARFADAHFATFPPELAERCIKAGTSERGACPSCGAPWVRVITKGEPDETHRAACGADASGGYNGRSTKDHVAHGVQDASAVKARILEGMRHRISSWRPSCECDAGGPVPCVVLDPFAGAFTAPLVADRLQRDAIGIELNPDYCAMARRRIARDAGLFAEIVAE